MRSPRIGLVVLFTAWVGCFSAAVSAQPFLFDTIVEGGTLNDSPKAITIDTDDGSFYVTGQITTGTATSVFGTMKYLASGAPAWGAIQTYPLVGDPGAAAGLHTPTAIAREGIFVVVTGRSPGIGTGFDYATVKYRADTGVRIWARRYNNPTANGDDTPSAVSGDANGRIFVGGSSIGSGTSWDYAAVAYEANGDPLAMWLNLGDGTGVRRYDRPMANGADTAVGIVVSQGVAGGGGTPYFYIGGTSYGGAVTGKDYLTLQYTRDSGTLLWAAVYNNGLTNGDDTAVAMTAVGKGVAVTGHSFGGGGELTPANTDIATVAYPHNTGGASSWVDRYNGPANGSDVPVALAVGSGFDEFGGKVPVLLLTGFSLTREPEPSGAVHNDIATLQYNPVPDTAVNPPNWVHRYGGLGDDRPAGIAPGRPEDHDTYIVATVNLGTVNPDMTTLKLLSNGTLAPGWPILYAGTGVDVARGIVTDPYTTGNPNNNLKVIITGDSPVGLGGSDWLTIKYGQN